MNIGKMRYRIQILGKTDTSDSEGNVNEDWQPLGTVWAGISSRTGTLTQKDYGLELSMVKEVLTRPWSEIIEGRRAVLDGKTYQIIHVDRLPGMYVSIIQLIP